MPNPFPQAKQAAVERALLAAFGTAELDGAQPIRGGLSGAGVWRIRVGGIAYLLRVECGLLRGSFVPPRAIRELRDLTRCRVHLQQDRNRVINRIGRLLETANVKLGFTTLKSYGALSVPVEADLGLPHLGLTTSGTAQATLNYQFDFGAGLDGSGFYVNTAPGASTLKINSDTRLPGFNH